MNIDDPQLPELTHRQEEILSLIVRAYTQSPEPISSKYLVETAHMGFSSATIRNEMAVLEELGYIVAPHTSAGRVPTENGYRYFVKHLLNVGDLSAVEQTHIAEKFQTAPLVTEQFMRHAATVLARTVNSAALITPPVAETSKFKHLELIAIQGRLVLMVLVVYGGAVHQQMLTLEESISQEQLSTIASRINALCENLNASEVRMKAVHLSLVERDVAELCADMIERADTSQVRSIYREGLSEIINSFQSTEGTQQAIRVFEERAVLNMILGEMLTPIINHVQVVIGGEGRWEELKHLSFVLSRYGVAGQFSGAVGVLGPTHLNYSRAVGAVRYVSGLMTSSLAGLYEGSNPPDKESDLPKNTPPSDEDQD